MPDSKETPSGVRRLLKSSGEVKSYLTASNTTNAAPRKPPSAASRPAGGSGILPKSTATTPAHLSSPGKPGTPRAGLLWQAGGETTPTGEGRMAAGRKALGLSAMAPSETVKGLAEVAKRAEKQAEREAVRKQAGGKLIANAAIHIDNTGRRWSLWVRLGLAAALVLVCLVIGLWINSALHPTLPPREATEKARKELITLSNVLAKFKPFEEDEVITPEKARQRLLGTLNTELAATVKRLEEWEKRTGRPNLEYAATRDELTKLLDLKDPWDNDLVININNSKTMEISVAGRDDIMKPITVDVRAHRAQKQN
jgi:hypothetical protein